MTKDNAESNFARMNELGEKVAQLLQYVAELRVIRDGMVASVKRNKPYLNADMVGDISVKSDEIVGNFNTLIKKMEAKITQFTEELIGLGKKLDVRPANGE